MDRPPLAALLDLVRSAGAAIEAIRAGGPAAAGAIAKADGSPQGAADRAADAVIRAGLAALDPDVPVLSEESAPQAEGGGWQRFWCIDPLDGTKEFLAGRSEFTVNLALVEAGHPVFGIVMTPVDGRLWWGGPDCGGAWIDGSPCRVTVPAAVPWRVVASRSHADAATEAWLTALGPHRRLAMGSSLKLCAVAVGEADLYPRLGRTMAWDIAAAHAVLLGAGGRIVRADGSELAYDAAAPGNPSFLAFGSADPQLLPPLPSVD